ncbi:MAG: cupin domain-containing protein [Nitrososphaeria archaeon]
MPIKVFNIKNVNIQRILGGPIKPLISNRDISKNQEFALGVFKPKEGLFFHTHPRSEETYFIVSGTGTVFVEELKKPVKVKEGDVVYIPAGMPHGVKNTGRRNLLIAFFLSPGDTNVGYSIGEDCNVLEEEVPSP